MQVDNANSLLSILAKNPGDMGPHPNHAKKAEVMKMMGEAARPPAPFGNEPTKLPELRPLDLGTSVDGDAGATISEEGMTVDGLLAEWGQKGSRYDFDGSGKVDMNDLRMLLSRQSAAAEVPAETPAPAEPSDPLTVEGLMKVWGQADDRYDFNSDGIVDYSDVKVMLNALAAMPEIPDNPETYDLSSVLEPAETVPPTPGNTPPGETPGAAGLTVDGLMAAWGEGRSVYDLDGNGSVDMADLLQLLSQQGEAVAEETPVPMPGTTSNGTVADPGLGDAVKGDVATPVVSNGSTGLGTTAPPTIDNAAPPSAVPTPAPEMTVDGLIAEWGADGSRYDLNRDGTVDMADLRTLLSRMSEHMHGPGAQPGPPMSTPGLERAEQVAHALVEKLHANGFGAQPPTNLHGIIEHLGLQPGERGMVIEHLKNAYPGGLGVNLVG